MGLITYIKELTGKKLTQKELDLVDSLSQNKGTFVKREGDVETQTSYFKNADDNIVKIILKTNMLISDENEKTIKQITNTYNESGLLIIKNAYYRLQKRRFKFVEYDPTGKLFAFQKEF